MKEAYLEFDLKGFKLQNGTVIDLKLAYQTYGSLNKAKDNVVLYPTYFAGRHTDNEWLIGKGKALDPENFFIIVPNLFGNGLSSSPSNMIGKYKGFDFPDVSVYDNVLAQHLLLTKHFEITKLKLAVGWSLGAMQVYHWAALFPNMVEKMVAFGGASRNSSRFQLIVETAMAALKSDENWMSGHYMIQPEKGIRLMANVYCPWAYSHLYFKEKLYIKQQTPSLEVFLQKRWENAFLQFDANDLLKMLETGIRSNLAGHPSFDGNLEKALATIKAKVLLMPGSTDLLFPLEDSVDEAQYISDVRVMPIPSIWGHASGIGVNKTDNDFIDYQLKSFLTSD
jgi:homoserine O-acetyltransferase